MAQVAGIGSVEAESTAVGALAARSTDTGRAEAGVTDLLCRGARGSNWKPGLSRINPFILKILLIFLICEFL